MKRKVGRIGRGVARTAARIAAAAAFAGVAVPALAQGGFGGVDVILPGAEAPGADWSIGHLFQPQLLGLFVIEVLVTLALSAFIAFHPVNYRTKERQGDLVLPRLYMLYGLIGMAIGFLVTQHGYFIGFVVFGIGGLLRFRSTFSSSEMTAEVILVTLLGLSVGLNLPVVAALIALAGWLVIWMTGTLTGYMLTVHCQNDDHLDLEIERFTSRAKELGWHIVSVERSFKKPEAEVLFQAKRLVGLAGVRRELDQLFDSDLTTWRLET